MASAAVRIVVPWGEVSGYVDAPAGTPRAVLLLAHGAGTRGDHPSLGALASALVGEGFLVARFNFPYTERGRRVPDPQPVLLDTWRGVLLWGREEWGGLRMLAGGRSMGGRMASLAAAEGRFDPVGLAFYAYPLHPPGREDRLRFDHLPRVTVPMLFLSGTRDSMARRELLQESVDRLGARASLVWLEGADHGYAVPKKAGLTREKAVAHAARATADWYEREVASK